MRSTYNILWLDDDFSNDTATLKRLVDNVKIIISNKGFIPKIMKVSNKNDALEYLKLNKKIDLFLSDYNIGDNDEFSGFDFLIASRKKYKQEMLLYSNQDEEELKSHLLKFLSKDDTALEFFGKFIFKSAVNRTLLIHSIEEIIDLTLIRWGELNALRGLYLSETSQIHANAKKYIKSNIDWSQFILNFNNNFSGSPRRKIEVNNALSIHNIRFIENLEFYEVQCILCDDTSFFKKWNQIREIRNGCAHVEEKRDRSGENYIRLLGSQNKLNIYEKEIQKYRLLLISFCEDYFSKFSDSEDSRDVIVTSATA